MNNIPQWVFTEYGSELSHIFWCDGVDYDPAGAETGWIIASTNLKAGEKILDLACGDGRHSMCFAEAGLIVTGVDCCTSQLAKAKAATRANNLNVKYCRGDFRNLSGFGTFDVITLLGNSTGVFINENDFYAFLQGVKSILRPGGYFIFDSAHDALVDEAAKIKRNWQQVGKNEYRLIERDYDREHGVYKSKTIAISGGRIISNNRHMKTFSHDAIKSMCERAGFKIIGEHGDLLGNPFSAKETLISLVLKR